MLRALTRRRGREERPFVLSSLVLNNIRLDPDEISFDHRVLAAKGQSKLVFLGRCVVTFKRVQRVSQKSVSIGIIRADADIGLQVLNGGVIVVTFNGLTSLVQHGR